MGIFSNEENLAREAVDYAKAIEAMYGVVVHLRLEPSGAGTKGAWWISAHASYEGEPIPINGAIQRGCSYPSAHHKTFGGAALKAVMDLEEAVRANLTLRGMRWDVE